MITTVTTTTVVAVDLTAAVSIAAVASLILFLVTRELVGASGSGTSLRVARFFNVGILPLAMAFAVIVAVKIAEMIV